MSAGTMSIADTAHMGGSGDGGVLSGAEIVYHMGQKDGLVTFAYGQLIENKWQIEKFELPTEQILGEDEIIKALEMSKAARNWAPIK